MSRLTKREKDLILTMIGIAEAGERGEGDYQDWTDEDYERLESIARKLCYPPVRRNH